MEIKRQRSSCIILLLRILIRGLWVCSSPKKGARRESVKVALLFFFQAWRMRFVLKGVLQTVCVVRS